MQLPESIDKITTEVKPSQLGLPTHPTFNQERFFECINEIMPFELRKYFDRGFNFYKLSDYTDKTFIKNLIALIFDFYKSLLADAKDIDIEKIELIKSNLDAVLKNFENGLDMHDNLLSGLKIDKKTFDAKKLFMIIIGYAIQNIKKYI